VKQFDLANVDSITFELGNDIIVSYPFNGNADDASGNNHHGEVFGATLCADRFGKANSAYHFNDSASYIRVDTLDMAFPLTLSVWFRSPAQNSGFSPVFFWNLHREPFYGISVYAYDWGHMFVRMGGYAYNSTANDVETPSVIDGDGKWHHIVAQKDARGNFKVFLDGVQFASVVDTSTPGSRYPLYIGKECHDYSWNGDIDDIVVYNRILTAQEVKAIYNAAR
jgi:hypothetical protein